VSAEHLIINSEPVDLFDCLIGNGNALARVRDVIVLNQRPVSGHAVGLAGRTVEPFSDLLDHLLRYAGGIRNIRRNGTPGADKENDFSQAATSRPGKAYFFRNFGYGPEWRGFWWDGNRQLGLSGMFKTTMKYAFRCRFKAFRQKC
jgi:hypothetical protein